MQTVSPRHRLQRRKHELSINIGTLSSNTAPTAGQACSVHGQAFDSTTESHASPLLINFCHHSSHHLIINAGPWMTSFFICRNRYPMLIQTHYKWWQLNGSRYPRLLNLALKYLGIQSTSTPSERVFSKAGDKLAA
jgi:hypothetical protein